MTVARANSSLPDIVFAPLISGVVFPPIRKQAILQGKGFRARLCRLESKQIADKPYAQILAGEPAELAWRLRLDSSR